ncbi:MAG: hypothetical protein L3K19_01205 [Thermoplasmata archaeon]|nr:hypothetical protein [Thermoplasmata archaeon]
MPAPPTDSATAPDVPNPRGGWAKPVSGALVGTVVVGGALWGGHLLGLLRPGEWAGPAAIGAPLLGLLAFVSPAGMTLPCWATAHPPAAGAARPRPWSSALLEWAKTRC